MGRKKKKEKKEGKKNNENYHRIDRGWKVTNLLKLLSLVILLGVIVFGFSIAANIFGFAGAPIFSVSKDVWVVVFSFIVLIVASYIVWIFLFFNSFWYKMEKEGLRIHKGILTKKETLIPYNKVRNINVTSGLYQRYLGIGTVTIELVGYTEADIIESEIPGIKDYKEVAESILSLGAKAKN